MSYAGGGLDTSRDNQVRTQVLDPLRRLAEVYQLALVYLLHLNKAVSQQLLYRGMGSMAWTAAPRSVLLLGRDPEDRREGAIVQVKPNNPEAAPVGYTIDGDGFHWLQETSLTVDQVLTGPLPGSGVDGRGGRPRADATLGLLRQLLADGPKRSGELEAELRAAGCSLRTAVRVRGE